MNYLYGVQKLSFKGAELGMISEDGLAPGGDSPTKTRVFGAQKPESPVVVLKSGPGTKLWSFTLIELTAANLVAVMGGEVAADGSYEAPTENVSLTGPFELTFDTGDVMKIPKAMLTANFANNINRSGVLGVACEIEIMQPDDGGKSFTIVPKA